MSQGGWRLPPDNSRGWPSYPYRPNGVFLIGDDLPPELQAGRPPWSAKWVKLSNGTTKIRGCEVVLDGLVILCKREWPPVHMHRDESISYTVRWPLKLCST